MSSRKMNDDEKICVNKCLLKTHDLNKFITRFDSYMKTGNKNAAYANSMI